MNIVIIYGGKSVEHDVSILTALHATKHIMDDAKVHLVYLTRDNKFLVGRGLSNIDFYSRYYDTHTTTKNVQEAFFRNKSVYKRGGIRGESHISKIDCVLNCCHGGVGENGDLAAFFRILGIPITSSPPFSAQKMMSKSHTRQLFTTHKFPQPKFVILTKNSTDIDLPLPLIIKPDTLGSSIGINIAQTPEELKSALDLASALDNTIIVEQFLENATEINCSAFFHNNKIHVSPCELIDKKNPLLDFENKYLDGGNFIPKKSNTKSALQEEPADPKLEKLFNKIQKITEQAYRIFGASGVVRFDFLITDVNDFKKTKIYLNEANSVPGFLSYHLWHRDGIPYGLLIDMLVKQAIADNKKELVTTFQSDILAKNRGLID